MNSVRQLVACVLLLAIPVVVLAAEDEKVEISKLPPKVVERLRAKFPGAKIVAASKTIEDGQVVYDIEMTKDGRKHEMDLHEDGSVVNFENQIDVKELPKAVADAVKAKHPEGKIKEAMETMVIKDGKDVLQEYEVIVETADKKEVEVALSPEGKVLE